MIENCRFETLSVLVLMKFWCRFEECTPLFFNCFTLLTCFCLLHSVLKSPWRDKNVIFQWGVRLNSIASVKVIWLEITLFFTVLSNREDVNVSASYFSGRWSLNCSGRYPKSSISWWTLNCPNYALNIWRVVYTAKFRDACLREF